MTRIHNPQHPGEVLRNDVLPALGLTVTAAAEQLGVTRAALSRVLNGRAAMSPEMARRLEGWLGVKHGGCADLWIAQQASYDLWQARKAGVPKVTRAIVHGSTPLAQGDIAAGNLVLRRRIAGRVVPPKKRAALAQEFKEARKTLPMGKSVMDEVRRGGRY
jgi:addiction module HigA family antidote